MVEPEMLEPIFLGGSLLAGGRWAFEPCRECQRRLEERQRRDEEQAKLNGYISRAGFLPVHSKMTLGNFQAPAGKLMEAVGGWREGKNGLWLFGSPGTGKTHIAAALLREFITKKRRPGTFCSVAKLIQDLRLASQTAPHLDHVGALAKAGALVLDDAGVERPTPFALEQLFLLVDALWTSDQRRVIVTSNLAPAALAERLGDRLVSRLAGLCRIVEMTGPDRRLRRDA